MDKINFQNKPNTTTPINATNLNQLQDNVESAINETKTWKLVGTVTSNDQMTLPTSFNELYIEVTVSGVYFTYVIPRTTLSDTAKRFRSGFHGYSGNGSGVGIDVSTSSAQLVECAIDNEYKMINASTTIYYK